MRTLLLCLIPLLASCSALGLEQSPVAFHVSVEGDADVLTELDYVVILGDAKVSVTAIDMGSGLPVWSLEAVNQSGDLALINAGEIHHHAYGSIALPAQLRPMFSQALLDEYPLLVFQPE